MITNGKYRSDSGTIHFWRSGVFLRVDTDWAALEWVEPGVNSHWHKKMFPTLENTNAMWVVDFSQFPSQDPEEWQE